MQKQYMAVRGSIGPSNMRAVAMTTVPIDNTNTGYIGVNKPKRSETQDGNGLSSRRRR
jgi:hypothetical protein